MMPSAPLSREHFDQVTTNPDGYRDKRGEWRSDQPVQYAPIFVPPEKPLKLLTWLRDYLFAWNLFFFAITAATWLYFQPDLATCRTFKAGWIAQMFVRNMVLLWIIYGGWHLYLYSSKRKGFRGKYSPRWQNKGGATFLFRNQVHDNIFWSCGSGCITWTAYEVVTMWMYANNHLPYLDFNSSPVLFVCILLLIPFWRELHFYWIHRLIHWKPLYDKIHYLHHYNINPGPWSGMAMHPIEHVLYFSVTLIHWIIPSHPIHFLYNAQHTALSPAAGHSGFEGELCEQVSFGSYFHYLHHRHFDCNYGESTIPLDKWFGSFNDGARTESEESEARRTYHSYVVDRIEEESPEVKSFYLNREDSAPLEPYAPGQHLMFKVPVSEEGNVAIRFYTLSNFDDSQTYRISVKREAPPPDQPDVPAGQVSNDLHDNLKLGDIIHARGPLGDFTIDVHSRKPVVLIAGGIGITPILSMLKGCLQRFPKRKINLFLAFRNTRLQVFRHEVEEILRKHSSVSCHVFFDEMEPGDLEDMSNVHEKRISLATLKDHLPHLNMDFYICGPNAMMGALAQGLKEAGVSRQRIHTESFNQGRNKDIQSAGTTEELEIIFNRSNKTLLWTSEFHNLLEFAESNGIMMEAGCMFGECGACSIRVESGEVEYNYTTAVKPTAGHCLACSCRPRTPLILDV
jgi:ferredoxin-NADP reductase/sterol desaturase/sphingolipid hydroxylase (fatty acid hydroxylase superfamily)